MKTTPVLRRPVEPGESPGATGEEPRRLRARWRRPLAVVGVCSVGIVALAGAGTADLTLPLGALAQGGAGAFVLLRSRHQGAQRGSSVLFGLALVANGLLAARLWGYALADRAVPMPSLVALLAVASIVATSVALLVHPVLRRERTRRCELVLDGIVAAVVALVIEWRVFLGDFFAVLSPDLRLRYVPLVLRVGGAVNVMLALLALHRARKGERANMAFLLGGLSIWALADLGWVHAATTQAADDVGYLTVAAAAVAALFVALGVAQPMEHRSEPASVPEKQRTGAVSAVVAGVTALVVVALAVRDPHDAVVVGCAVGLTALVLVRQVLTILDRLSDSASLEEVVRRQERRWEALIHNFTDCLTLLDRDGRIVYDSPSVERLLGYRPGERNNLPGGDFLHPDDRAVVATAWSDGMGTAPVRVSEQRMRRADGGWRWTEAVFTNLLDVPEVGAVVVNYRDIEDRRSLEGQLRRLAFSDVLTGLANRARLMEELDRMLAASDASSEPTAVLLVDLDGFKVVNDSLGHEAGDELLAWVAKRMTRVLRPHDLAARLGGDEFAVMLPRTELPMAQAVAERVLDALRHPFNVDGRHVVVQASIGVAVGRCELSTDGLLSQADVAMYAAKAAGKGQVRTFNGDMHEAAVDRLRLASDLGAALDRGELGPYYQPVVDVQSGRIVGFEALARWDHPDRGPIPAAEFIALAEETGLIVDLGHHMFTAACAQLSDWQRRYERDTPLRMNVNISPTQFQHPDMVGRTLSAFAGVDIAPGSLCFELTESTLIGSEDVIAKLERLRTAGISLAIDDFGTGYSSLGYLRTLPVDVVKIDRSLVEGIAMQPEQWAVARAIVKLLHTLGLESIAEGVERADQMTHLRSLGCTYAQGYFYARPVPAADAEALLEYGGPLPAA